MPRHFLLPCLVATALLSGAATPPSRDAPCDAAQFHAFDYMLGDWDVFDVATPDIRVARNQVTRMVGSCALREVHRQDDGLLGEAITIYDRTRDLWHQTWVTNRGDLLLLEGRMESGRLVLTAPERHPDGSTSLLRGTWWVEGRTVRQLAERSHDGGRSWTPVWDIVFRPHAE